jgi:hypothetical protein
MLDCFHSLAILWQLLLWTSLYTIRVLAFISLESTPGGTIAESYGNPTFTFWKNCQTVFRNDHLVLQQCTKVSFLYSLINIWFPFLKLTVILTGPQWHIIVVLILFLCLLGICVLSLEKCLFKFNTHCLIRLAFVVELQEFHIYLDINLISNVWFANSFSYSVVVFIYLFCAIGFEPRTSFLLGPWATPSDLFAFVIFQIGSCSFSRAGLGLWILPMFPMILGLHSIPLCLIYLLRRGAC